MGLFEEEEEGTGVVSDVVKVQGEDPATPGPLPLRNDPGTVTISQYWFNKNKATHTARRKLQVQGRWGKTARIWKHIYYMQIAHKLA